MRISKWKYSNHIFFFVAGLLLIISLVSCKIKDEVAPILTLNGEESISHPLNQVYNDAGATATDDTDGDLTGNIFVENNVNEDILGFYSVIYNVVDQAGNSALPLEREVRVINSAYPKIGYYKAKDIQVFPAQDTCSYDVYFDADSTVNYRMVFTSFACENGLNVVADLTDTLIVIPFQTIEDTIRKISFQGAGYINDTLIYIEYSKTSDSTTSYWNAVFNRQL